MAVFVEVSKAKARSLFYDGKPVVVSYHNKRDKTKVMSYIANYPEDTTAFEFDLEATVSPSEVLRFTVDDNYTVH